MARCMPLALVVVLAISRVGWAQTREVPVPVSVVFIDSRSTEGQPTTDPAPNLTVVVPVSRIDGSPLDCLTVPTLKQPSVAQMWALLECAAGERLASDPKSHVALNPDRKNVFVRGRAAALIGDSIRALAESNSQRSISSQGDRVLLVVVHNATLRLAELSEEARKRLEAGAQDASNRHKEYPTPPAGMAQNLDRKALEWDFLPTRDGKIALTVNGRTPKIAIKESERRSQIGRDIEALVKLAFGIVLAPPKADAVGESLRRLDAMLAEQLPKAKLTTEATTWSTIGDHTLLLERATVTTDATFPADGAVRELAAAQSAEVLKELQELIRQTTEQEQLAALEKNVQDLETCPPAGLRGFSQLHLLVCQLFNGTTTERAAAADGLGELKPPDAVGPLRKVMLDSMTPSDVRAAAARALGKLTQPTPARATGGSEPASAPRSATLISGPAEHWFISADVMLTRKTLGMDTSGSVTLNNPSSFYVGFDFLLGDLPSSKRTLLQNVVLKGLIKGSKHPEDSFGFGLGFRGSYLKRFGLDFELLSPFVAWTYTKDDEDRVREIRVGVSVNVDAAIKWLK
jgi:hypothetical protein